MSFSFWGLFLVLYYVGLDGMDYSCVNNQIWNTHRNDIPYTLPRFNDVWYSNWSCELWALLLMLNLKLSWCLRMLKSCDMNLVPTSTIFVCLNTQQQMCVILPDAVDCPRWSCISESLKYKIVDKKVLKISILYQQYYKKLSLHILVFAPQSFLSFAALKCIIIRTVLQLTIAIWLF